MRKYHIALTGGGSGGHVYPLLAVARKLEEKLPGQVELLYIGSDGQFEKEAMRDAGIRTNFIMSGKWRRYSSAKNFSDVFKMFFGLLQSLWYLFRFMPDVVFSKGGAAAVPVVIAAWIYRIPVLTHESDAMPGSANRVIGKFADRIAVGYATAKSYFSGGKTVFTGNPVRPEILSGSADRARQRFGLHGNKPVLAVLGGSQGAKSLNWTIVGIATPLMEHFQIVHQTGSEKYDQVIEWAGNAGIDVKASDYHPIPFLDAQAMGDLLAVADVIIARAGAGVITEVAAVARAALILVPHRQGSNRHQEMNASEIVESGGAVVIDETDLGENIILNKAIRLWHQEPERLKMQQALKAWYKGDAADVIANGVIGLLKK